MKLIGDIIRCYRALQKFGPIFFFLLKLQLLPKLGVLFLIHFILNKTNISNQDGLLYFFNIF